MGRLMSYQLEYDADEPMPAQTADWTCSACSLAWINRALGIQVADAEWSAVDYIGTPDNINSTYGLMDGSGGRLRDCLRAQGAPAVNGWWEWETVIRLCDVMPLLIGGVAWNHWVGVRGYGAGYLELANSAPGWMGIEQMMDYDEWLNLGPFAVVAVPLLLRFPPPPTV